jgi:pimeloyl-ACP methyl ester carboxylesterase
MSGARPFKIDVAQEVLDDLSERLERGRRPPHIRGPVWSEGVDPGFLSELVEYWRATFDWRAQERELNRVAHFLWEIDGLDLHFVHERGRGPDPLPLILTHGWPSTFHELLPLLPLLTDPEHHGGDPADAFDVVIPSLPGYAFSAPLRESGSSRRIPGLWVRLMPEVLGYERFAAQGSDIGAHGPFGWWTVRIAVVITPVIAAAAAGVARPSASSPPPPASDAPAASACWRPGRRPSDSKKAPVPSGPWPANQPLTFCMPWPKNSPPSSRRRTKTKSFMA